MPLLMMCMETGPLKWCYKKYKLPVMKVITQILGYFALLVLYAYMLLFNLNKELSYMDMFIAGWMSSFFLNEIKQAFVSTLRKRFKNYLKDSWNQLDWALMVVYAAAMILKFGDDQTYQDASQILLVVTFILLSIRILHMFSMSQFLGPKLVIIHKMFKDTFIFMIILTVIMLSYNVSFHSLHYPNSELSWKEIEKIMQNGYWMLFGELNLDRDTLREPECTFNKTIYNSDAVPRCPTTLELHVVPYLKAIYGLIAVILLLNLLIAIYSDTFEKVQQESEFHWSQLRNGFLEEFSVKTIFPIHLQLLELPFCLVHFIIWYAGFCDKRKTSNKVHHGSINQRPSPVDRETLNGKPMFVRVFLYNTNYDLKLQSTKDEEGIGTSKSKGTLEVMEEDTVTILQKQMEIQNSKLEKQHDEVTAHLNLISKKILEELKNIKRYMVKPKKFKDF
ncbi:transient receptor potential cation channel subfamily M member-like 2 [Mytilus californianus]|uniref:transient receptor potential cation channel subfamily M member-like 2 n=1 Tax=Mytilus californianus TaxID=6549 RepID=UPI0022482E24|nr:transient receptor potential cation channel subfamily M member-like 2 [Mytilus californianus]